MTALVGVLSAIGHIGYEPDWECAPEIVRRFFWFLPLTDDEARAIARRLR